MRLFDSKHGSEVTLLSEDAGAIVVRYRARYCLDQSLTRGPSDAGRPPARVAAGCDGSDEPGKV